MKCPYCGHKFDCHKTIDGDENYKDGDISFCFKCGKVGVFEGDHTVAKDESTFTPLERAIVDKLRYHWHYICGKQSPPVNHPPKST